MTTLRTAPSTYRSLHKTLQLSTLQGEFAHTPENIPSHIQAAGLFHPAYPYLFQILEREDMQFLGEMTEDRREQLLNHLHRQGSRYFIFPENSPQLPLAVGLNAFTSPLDADDIVATINRVLPYNPPPLEQHHGVLVQVNQRGMFITGEPGCGKSSLALALLDHGHKLVADDVVFVSINRGQPIGASDPAIAGFLHSRVLGAVNVAECFHPTQIIHQTRLDAVLRISQHKRPLDAEVSGSGNTHTVIMGIKLPRITLYAGDPHAVRLVEIFSRQLGESSATHAITRLERQIFRKTTEKSDAKD